MAAGFSVMARLAGFEPTTPWFVAKYSIQLSYSRKIAKFSSFLGLGRRKRPHGPAHRGSALFLSGGQRGLHQIGHRAGLDLIHDIGPMCLYRFNADIEIISDLFIQTPCHDTIQHLLLAWG